MGSESIEEEGTFWVIDFFFLNTPSEVGVWEVLEQSLLNCFLFFGLFIPSTAGTPPPRSLTHTPHSPTPTPIYSPAPTPTHNLIPTPTYNLTLTPTHSPTPTPTYSPTPSPYPPPPLPQHGELPAAPKSKVGRGQGQKPEALSGGCRHGPVPPLSLFFFTVTYYVVLGSFLALSVW